MILQKSTDHELMGNTRRLFNTLASLKKTFAISLCIALVSAGILYFVPTASAAGNLDINAFTVKVNPDGTSDYALNLQVVILMGLLSFIPSILVMMR